LTYKAYFLILLHRKSEFLSKDIKDTSVTIKVVKNGSFEFFNPVASPDIEKR